LSTTKRVTTWFAWNLSTWMAMTYAPQNVPHHQKLDELEKAGREHQEQGSPKFKGRNRGKGCTEEQ
ncbi:MAG: hypothetical protein WA815_21275, partial [Terracidiphilus sp.]